MELLNIGRKRKSWAKHFSLVLELLVWKCKRNSYVEIQRRGSEEISEAVLEGTQVHNIMENVIKCDVKNSIWFLLLNNVV